MFEEIFTEPVPPLNVKDPVIAVWRAYGNRKEKVCANMQSARAYAIRILGGDDRNEVRLFDKKTKAKRGKVALFGGQPYWYYDNRTWSLTPDGRLLKDWFDY